MFDFDQEIVSATLGLASATPATEQLVTRIRQQQAGKFSTFFGNEIVQGDIAIVVAAIETADELGELTHYLQKAKTPDNILIPVLLTEMAKAEIDSAIAPLCSAYLICLPEQAEQKISTLCSVMLNFANQNDQFDAIIAVDFDDLKSILCQQSEIDFIEITDRHLTESQKERVSNLQHMLLYIESHMDLTLEDAFEMMNSIGQYADPETGLVVGCYVSSQLSAKDSKQILFYPKQ